MDEQERHGDRHAALASDARRQVLELLKDSDVPLDATAVAAIIGLHVTTVRFHLDQLESAGLIRRAAERAGVRGRPRILFSIAPAAREDGAQLELSQALASAIAWDDDGGRARAIRAGEHWSVAYADELPAGGTDAVGPLVRILDRLGFDPHRADAVDDLPETPVTPGAASAAAAPDVGLVIELRACPFRDEARRAPDVICAVHLGFIRGVARELGRNPDDTELLPFVRPNLCHVRLAESWAERSVDEATPAQSPPQP
jgi:predicted ArsR family transcriptional regulator